MASEKQLINVEIQKAKKLEREHKIINGIDHKLCNKHHEFFPEESPWIIATQDNFYYSKCNKSDFLHPSCKKCGVKSSQKNRADNLELRLEYDKNYYHDRKEERLFNSKKWQRDNKERWDKYEKEYRQNNPEKCRLYGIQHQTHTVSNKEWEECKKYFNHRCAYCGLPIEEQYYTRNGITKLGDLHKEHKDHFGSNGLENCVPACSSCNSKKWIFTFDEWYNELNINYTQERHDKILQWINEDHKPYIIEKKPKRKYQYKDKL